MPSQTPAKGAMKALSTPRQKRAKHGDVAPLEQKMKRSAAVKRNSLGSRRLQSHTELYFNIRELVQPRTNRFDTNLVDRRRAQPDNVVGQAGPSVAALLPSNHTCRANQAKQRPEAMLCFTRAPFSRDSSEQCPPRLRTTARSASKVSANRHTSAQCHRPSNMHAPEHTPGACSVRLPPSCPAEHRH